MTGCASQKDDKKHVRETSTLLTIKFSGLLGGDEEHTVAIVIRMF